MRENTNPATETDGPPRRHFLRKGLLALIGSLPLIGALVGKKALAEESKSGLTMEGDVLHTSVYKGRPPMEPLDTMIRFERSDDNNGRAMTHEVLSLMHEEKGANSYPWTIYAGLSTHHQQGDACVLCSRLHKRNRGWSTGLHSEVFNHGPMVGLGVNVEMSNDYAGTEPTVLYGINIMACGPKACQGGLVIKNNGSGPGAVFEKQISLESSGPVGIDVSAKFDVGLDMHGNSIRLGEGARIEFGDGSIRMRVANGRIEFMNGDKCVGHIDVDGKDHRI